MAPVKYAPYVPVRVTTGRTNVPVPDQRLFAAVDPSGVPRWQPGDTNVASWPISGIAWCHGSVATRSEWRNVTGYVYLTDARVVAVVDAAGARPPAGIVIDGREQTRRLKPGEVTFRAGQMRLPWLTGLVFAAADSTGLDAGQVRFGGEHTSTSQAPESVMLLVWLTQAAETVGLAHDLVARVYRDRYDWLNTSDQDRAELDALPMPASVEAAPGTLPRIRLPGGYRARSKTAGNGVNSARSCLPG
jgi:hypothetical protein